MSPDRRVAIALAYTAGAAVLLYHYGRVPTALALLPQSFRGEHIQLHVRSLWAAIHVVFYLVIPLGLARACGVETGALGLRLRSVPRQLWLVAALALGALPVVFLASRTAVFLSAYPIYRPGPMEAGSIVLWFGVLGAYLLSIELFFRGFLLAMLTPALGRYALLVALFPYVATHSFWPEVLGAIPVGLFLGVLCVRSGSLWPGYLAHLLIAVEIELLAQWRHGLF